MDPPAIEPGKDYIVTIRIHNGRFRRAMLAAGFKSTRALSMASGVSRATILGYLALRQAPVGRHGQWKQSVLILAETLDTTPAELFPPQHYTTPLLTNAAEVEMSLDDVGNLLPPVAGPQDLLEVTRDHEALHRAIAMLRPRLRRALEMRFGLNGEEEAAYETIAADPDVIAGAGGSGPLSRERARQLVMQGLRKLRSPKLLTAAGLDLPPRRRKEVYQLEAWDEEPE